MTQPIWISQPIEVDGVTLEVSATENLVDYGKTVSGVYASDTLLPPSKARLLAYALLKGADYAEGVQS